MANHPRPHADHCTCNECFSRKLNGGAIQIHPTQANPVEPKVPSIGPPAFPERDEE